MKAKFLSCFSVMVILLILFTGVSNAQAGGMPGGGQFGFGARMDTGLAPPQASSSTATTLALAMAAQSQLNWIAFNLDWASVAPQSDSIPDLSGLAALVGEAYQQNMEILLSIHNPPAWALTGIGPAPEHIKTLINQVSRVAANHILVVELFPGANTTHSWGAPANPTAYLAALQAARDALRANQQVSLVIPSLTPLSQPFAQGDLGAEEFLTTLYQLAPNENFQVVGLHYAQITGSPAENIQPGTGAFLRQYETIRQVMLDNGRSSDQMWITAFAWPQSLTNETDQAAWVEAAYRQLQGQIYIKAAFFNALFLGSNPGSSETGSAALLYPSLQPHAALTRIRALAAQGGSPNPASVENKVTASPLARLWEFFRSLLGWH